MAIRLAIDWDDLTMAFDARSDGVEWYLDTQTGKCVMIALELGFDEDAELMEQIEGDTEGRYREIPDRESSRVFDLMADFAANAASPEARRALEDALDGRRPFRRFKDAAGAHGVLDAWHQTLDRYVLEQTLDWLRREGIEPTNLPASLAHRAADPDDD
ncbi:MAG: hypothetical protein KC583_16265 [Myxococcales bacterium]|nr:hypothetical protein [Myxococcales bacterium]